MPVDAQRVAEILGGRKLLLREVATARDLRDVVEAGLPIGALDRTVERVFGRTGEAEGFKYRIVPRTTLNRRRGDPRARLSPEESERTERLARITALAEYVFEDGERAREFLTSAQPNLGGERPVDLVRSDLGTREVEDLLWGLEYSLPV